MLACCASVAAPVFAAGRAVVAEAAAEVKSIVAGWLLRIDGDEYFIDLGSADGLTVGADVRLFRTIRAKHPVTGKEVVDHFPVGVAATVEVASHLAILKPDADTRKALAVGDRVEFDRPKPVAPPPVVREAKPAVEGKVSAEGKTGHVAKIDAKPVTCPACAACPACPPPVHVAVPGRAEDELDDVFLLTLGQTPPERIKLWRTWLTDHPKSPYANAVRREIDALTELGATTRVATNDAATVQRAQIAAQKLVHDRLGRLRVGEPAWLVFSAADWSDTTDLRVYYRQSGEGTFHLLRPERSGHLHRRVQLPQTLVKVSGFEYFVAQTRVDGSNSDLVGSVRAPLAVAVSDPFAEVGKVPADATTLRFMGEYVDFNRFQRDDQVAYAEMTVTYRLQDPVALYAFDLGYGVFNGGGGKVAGTDLFNDDGTARLHTSGQRKGLPILKDDTIDPRSSSFKYAYLSTEWILHPIFHVLTRFVVGLDRTGLNSGLELMGRIGNERGTNLRLGLSTLGDLGRAASIAMTTNVIERLPMSGIFEVTNRPVGDDIGIRLIYQADWHWTDHVGLSGRIGYNLRTINHAGLSLGGGMVFSW